MENRTRRFLFLTILLSLVLPGLVSPGFAANVVNYGTDHDDNQMNLGAADPDNIIQ